MTVKKQKNFYLVLQVSPEASFEEIKKAYLKMAKIYHPDKNKGKSLALKRFQQINEAWEILKDQKKRKTFDENLKIYKEKQALVAEKKKAVLERRLQQAKVKKSDKAVSLEVPFRISLEDICFSKKKTLHYFRSIKGKKVASTIEFSIPRTARNGTRLLFKDKGGGDGGKKQGNLYILLKLKAHSHFQTIEDSDDLMLNLPVPFLEMFDKKSRILPSPYGLISVELETPCKDGELLKVKEKGLPKPKSGQGDLFIKICIEYPKEDGKRIKEKFAKCSTNLRKAHIENYKTKKLTFPKSKKFEKKIDEIKEKLK